MSIYKDIETTLQGEQQLARLILPCIPLIERHFKPFDGKRAILASGSASAPFSKVKTAFRKDCDTTIPENTFFQVFPSHSNNMSIYVEFKTTIRDPRSDCGVIYFSHSVYIGQVNDKPAGHSILNGETFKYEYQDTTREYCDNILNETVERLTQVKNDVTTKAAELNAIKDSVLYPFKDCIKDPYARS